jgi:hypothetical protein
MIKLQILPNEDDKGKATLINTAMISSIDIRERWFRSSTDTEDNVKMPDARGKLIGYEATIHMAGGETVYLEEKEVDTILIQLRQKFDVVILRPFDNNFYQGPEVRAQWCDKCKYYDSNEKKHIDKNLCKMCFGGCNFEKMEVKKNG